ncbi:tetratricopeptide repeat protein [Rhodanobacter ginsengisoli]|uniref:Tetratricopeptide repeat protein n=1 Tax=Rhodanobacter ginsengisoli TaxID=418646 RepID=A0ABW0QRH7_9GAMM
MKTAISLPLLLVLGVLIWLPTAVCADAVDSAVTNLEHTWAHVTYELPKTAQDAAYTALEAQAAELGAHYPQRAEPKVWQAIILSTHAGEHGGLGALSMAKQARDLLLQAGKISPDVLHGSIYTTLGSLYCQVPGWPLGFGNKDKARALLQQALRINPDGIDPNYFYGDCLSRNDDRTAALAALDKALAAPPRPDQPLADKGRREQVRKLIQTLQSSH